MPAYKVLPVVFILALVVFTGVFWFFEDMRPAAVDRLFLNAAGYSPAKTPSDCLDKFKKAIRDRNFKAASTFCAGEYGEELRRSSKRAKQLGDSVEDLLHNVKNVANINAPKAEIAVRLLYPFPNDFKVLDLQHKDGTDEASAVLLLVGETKDLKATLDDVIRSNTDYKFDPRIIFAATPTPWDGSVGLKLEGDKQKSWKIHFPQASVSALMRDKMQYLRDNGGNYVRALDNVKYSVKHDAATKSDFENELRKQLSEAK